MLHDLIWNETYIAIDELIILKFSTASLFITKGEEQTEQLYSQPMGFDWWRADKGQ